MNKLQSMQLCFEETEEMKRSKEYKKVFDSFIQEKKYKTCEDFFEIVGDISKEKGFLESRNSEEFSTFIETIIQYSIQNGVFEIKDIDLSQLLKSLISRYEFCNRHNHPGRSKVLNSFAFWLISADKEAEAFDQIKKVVYNNFVDWCSYDGFEYFSFCGFSDRVFDQIYNHKLSLSYPGTFNDPMDTLLFWHNQKMIEAEKDITKRNLLMLYQKAYDHIKVKCFVRNNRLPRDPKEPFDPMSCKQNIEDVNPLMWAHYAQNHTGLCIKYRFSKETVKNENDQSHTWTRIGAINYTSTAKLDEETYSSYDVLFRKHNIWEDENEVRLIHYDPDNDENYKEIEIPEDSIVDVYLGLRCSDENKSKMKRILRNKSIHLYQMMNSEEDIYKLEAIRIM